MTLVSPDSLTRVSSKLRDTTPSTPTSNNHRDDDAESHNDVEEGRGGGAGSGRGLQLELPQLNRNIDPSPPSRSPSSEGLRTRSPTRRGGGQHVESAGSGPSMPHHASMITSISHSVCVDSLVPCTCTVQKIGTFLKSNINDAH